MNITIILNNKIPQFIYMTLGFFFIESCNRYLLAVATSKHLYKNFETDWLYMNKVIEKNLKIFKIIIAYNQTDRFVNQG